MDFTTIKENFLASIKQELPNANASENSNLYKIAYPMLNEINNLYSDLQDFIDNKYVYTAEGEWLDKFLSNFNFIRKQGSKAITYIITNDSTPFTTVLEGELQVQDTNENVFTNTDDFLVDGTGFATIKMESVGTGSVQNVAIGTLTDIVTPVSGINTVSNFDIGEGGQDQENDTQFRNRYLAGRQGKGLWNTDGIQSSLLALDGVISAVVEENDTNATVGSLTAHSIRCIVDGGEDEEIAQVIFEKTDSGITKIGNTSIVYSRTKHHKNRSTTNPI